MSLLKAESYKELADEELIHRYRNSHQTAYVGELYQRYTHLVFGVCIKYYKNVADAEDATMQIFEHLIKELKKHDIQSFKPWLHVVVKNHCMMRFRKEASEGKKQGQWEKDTQGVVESGDTEHLNEVEDKEFILKHLHDGIEELKEEQRTCIELFYMKNCSYSEITAITGYNTKEVKSHIQNGKRNLKNIINKKNDRQQKG
ncbi:MAG: sigma-70 family RNA polymerase sigma factor [Bacteroidetes bacterium]|nr:sigma-70 family RNA polymerase sigma factor [Bacteroidota bacterium]